MRLSALALEQCDRLVCVPAQYSATRSLDENTVEIQDRIVSCDEEIGIECNRRCGMESVCSANSTGLKIKLLKLKTHGRGCQIQHRDAKQLDYHLHLGSDRSRCGDEKRIRVRNAFCGVGKLPIQRLFDFVIRQARGRTDMPVGDGLKQPLRVGDNGAGRAPSPFRRSERIRAAASAKVVDEDSRVEVNADLCRSKTSS